jgi:hypothetical protein
MILFPDPNSLRNNRSILMKLGMNIMPQRAPHPGLKIGVDAVCLVTENFFNIAIYSAYHSSNHTCKKEFPTYTNNLLYNICW